MALDFTTSLIKLNNQYTIVGTSEDIAEDAVPKKGELYFLPVDGGQRVCKIGDGETPFGELPQIGVETATASTYGTAMASSTSPVMDGTASVGTETTKFARGDHKHPTDTSRAPTNHASSASTYGLGTTSNYGHVKISNGDVATVSSADGLVAGMNHSHSDLAPSGHTHDVNITTSAATNELTLAHGSKYALTAGGQSFVFTMPSSGNTDYKASSYNTSSKIYLIGATSQGSSTISGQTTYSHDTAYVGTDGCLYSNNTKVSVVGHTHNASNITAGTLPVSRGGTGATTAGAARKNLGAAEAGHDHTQANLVSWLGLGKLNDSSTWGTLTSSNEYTIRLGADQTDGGGLVIAEKGGRTSLQVDGEIYVSEGAKRLAHIDETPKMSDDGSDFPAGIKYGVIFSSNPVTKNTANNDNYLLHISDYGTLHVGYQINQMTTPTWNAVSLDGHKHSASDLTSGTLSIARGGTGATTADAALKNLGALPKAGGTMTGKLTLMGNINSTGSDEGVSGALDLSNSSIINVDGLYIADYCDGYHEGIHFPRSDNSNYDSFFIFNGIPKLVRNRTKGKSGTAIKILTAADFSLSASGTVLSITTI